VPRTSAVDEFVDSYFAEGWHTRDIRAERAVPLLLAGAKVVTDHDILALEEMERAGLYAESLIPTDCAGSQALASGPARRCGV
jgi:hypothetical protein